MLEKPRFLQGVYSFNGQGVEAPKAFSPPLHYRVPSDKRSQLVYFRGGNSADEMICLVMLRDGKPMRYFPLGAKSAIHVSLSVVEDLHPDTELELQIAAPAGVAGSVVIDIGIMEF